MLSFMLGLCSDVENMRLAREIEERRQYNALQMKKSSKETATSQSQSDSVSQNVAQKSKKSQQL